MSTAPNPQAKSATSSVATAQQTARIARIAVIAAAYAAATLVSMLFLGSFAWGPIQFRISEALCVLALFSPEAVAGLTLGCVISNVANMVISGTGALGLLDVVFGSAATCVGALVTYKLRRKPALAVLGPVLANAIIVSAYLPILLQGLGFYTIPFTSIALDGSWPLMFAFGFVTTGIGEAAVLYILGLPLAHAIQKSPLAARLQTTVQTPQTSAAANSAANSAADKNTSSEA